MRVVVHPKYRTIGLGAKLVRETLPLLGCCTQRLWLLCPDTIPSSKAGLREIMERLPDHEITEAIEQLHQLESEPTLLSSIRYNLEKLKSINPMEIMKCRETSAKLRSPRLHKFADSHAPYGRHARYRDAVEKASLEKLAKIYKALSFLAQTKVYLLWKNPRVTLN